MEANLLNLSEFETYILYLFPIGCMSNTVCSFFSFWFTLPTDWCCSPTADYYFSYILSLVITRQRNYIPCWSLSTFFMTCILRFQLCSFSANTSILMPGIISSTDTNSVLNRSNFHRNIIIIMINCLLLNPFHIFFHLPRTFGKISYVIVRTSNFLYLHSLLVL